MPRFRLVALQMTHSRESKVRQPDRLDKCLTLIRNVQRTIGLVLADLKKQRRLTWRCANNQSTRSITEAAHPAHFALAVALHRERACSFIDHQFCSRV
jgi:hypothetical protein